MSFERISGDCLEIREGGGCLTFFGLPFLAAGIFLMLTGLGLVPLENAQSMNWWSRPLLMAMGLIFAAVGGSLVFARTRITLDAAKGTMTRRWWLLLPIKNEEFRLKSYRSVELGFSSGDSDSPDTYPLVLKGGDACPDFQLKNSTSYGESRQLAVHLAELLRVPLEEATSDHRTILKSEELQQSLTERLQKHKSGSEDATRPVHLLSRVEMVPGGVLIRIPREGFKWTLFLPIAISVGGLLYFGPGFLEFFDRTFTPVSVQIFFLGFAVILFGLIPFFGLISKILNAARGYTEIMATTQELRLTEQGAWKKSTATFPAGEIVDLDYSTASSRAENAMIFGNERIRRSQFGTQPPVPPRWLKALNRLNKSQGVIVKHREGLLTFGAGLPDEEIRYLQTTIKRALSGK
ncbi:hypothetical protein SAMN04489760_10236 [Syntrophus gentianae]|uniref:PH domain-containing protein n=2 Tax=Syntrophus gentianae TaxID=43775 RepID=A0A1H7UQY6_9BACT|nr:hypothetical protein SAMN04489760_10236 [Syntrophus gentianae]